MNDLIKINLEITIPKRWLNKFMQMLDCMRWFSRNGASRTVAFYADGDGDFRPFDFKVDSKEVKAGINWWDYDKGWNPDPKNPDELPPRFKTRRGVDFFFDAG